MRRRALEIGAAGALAGLVAASMLARGVTGLATTSVAAPVTWIVLAVGVRALVGLVTEEYLAGEQRRLRAQWFGHAVGFLARGTAGAVHDLDTAIDHVGEEPTVAVVAGTMCVAPVGLVVVFVMAGWVPAVIVVGLTALAVPAYVRVGRQSAAVAEEFQRRRRSIVVRQLEMLRSVLDLRALGAVSFGADEIAAESDAEHRAVMAGFRVTVRSTLVTEFLAGVTVGLVAMDVGLGLWHHHITLLRALVAVLVTAEMASWLRRYGAEFHRRDDAHDARRALTARDDAAAARGDLLLDVHEVATDAPAGAASFQVPEGGRVLVAGPSGVGKTLLLEAALGLRVPATGTVHRSPEPVALVRAVNHFVDGTVRDNVTLGAPVDAGLVDRVATDLGLDPRTLEREISADGHALSTGEGVLVCVARGAVAGARLFVLDDVAGTLDPAARARLGAYFEARPELAVVEAAHDVRVLSRFSAQVALVPS